MTSLGEKRVKLVVIQSMFIWSSPEQIRKTEEVVVLEGELGDLCKKHLLLNVGRLHQQAIVNLHHQARQVTRTGNLMEDHRTDNKVKHHSNTATGALLLLNVEVNGVTDLDLDLLTPNKTVDLVRDHLMELLARHIITCHRLMEILLGVLLRIKDIRSTILATILRHKDNQRLVPSIHRKPRSSE